MTTPLKLWRETDGRVLRLRLSRPNANLIDSEMNAALDRAIAEHAGDARLAAILLDAEGPDFSFGADIEDHSPERCAAMLAELHGLVLRMVDSPIPIVAAVRGRCLGGGLEIALAAHLTFVAPEAALGQPEITLGVFAPAASCLLPELIGPTRAFDLLVSGRTISGADAAAIGLAFAAAADPEQAARSYIDGHLLSKSASALRVAVRAARSDYAARVRAKLLTVERLYLDELMKTRDALEGLQAFMAKRPAQWEHR